MEGVKESTQTQEVVQKKELRPVVAGLYHFKEQSKTTQRVVTVQYKYDRKNNQLSYGAVIWKDSPDSKSKYDRKAHNQTANERFTKYPVVVDNFQDDGNLTDFQKNVRKQVYRYGVRNRVKTPVCSPTTSVSI